MTSTPPASSSKLLYDFVYLDSPLKHSWKSIIDRGTQQSNQQPITSLSFSTFIYFLSTPSQPIPVNVEQVLDKKKNVSLSKIPLFRQSSITCSLFSQHHQYRDYVELTLSDPV
ncbi:hypothetical protein CYY_003207, partial [Polysphondylium violaceum]